MNGVQNLLLGGAISLTTAVILFALQAVFQARREREQESRTIRERFFNYDLERLRQLEALTVEIHDYMTSAKTKEIETEKILDFITSLDNVILVSTPNFVTQVTLNEGAQIVIKRMYALSMSHMVYKQNGDAEPLTDFADRKGILPYNRAAVELSEGLVNLIRLYRSEVLGEHHAWIERELKQLQSAQDENTPKFGLIVQLAVRLESWLKRFR